jgi:uncharacterized protein
MAILRKIKDKLRQTASKKKRVVAEKRQPVKRISKVGRVKTVKSPVLVSSEAMRQEKEALGYQQTAIEKAKYSTPQIAKFRRSMPQELPAAYHKDQIRLQVRDPWWLHTYWEVTVGTFERLKQQLKDLFSQAKKALRVYDVSQIMFNGHNAHRYFDIEVAHDAQSWYIDTGGPGRSWCVDYGLKLPNGEFITIVRSNVVHTPIEGPSWVTDEEWMVPDEMFGRLYGMGFGLGQSSPVGKAWQERIKKALFSGVLASPGITSAGSPVKKPGKQRSFWMVVDCELIVYGATEPDATVFVQGKQIKLRPDGTFTMRYALPDGKQVIPVKGISADKEEERNITPIVTRETKIG